MLDGLYSTTPVVAYAASIAIVVLGALVGRAVGAVWGHTHAEQSWEGLLSLEQAGIGLLALIIGFTFSIALSRHDARQNGVVEEANAISTTALLAQAIPPPQARHAKTLFYDYVKLRIDLGVGPPDMRALEHAVRRSRQLQDALWQDALAASAADPHSVPVGLFMRNLTGTFDEQDRRIAAARNRVPFAVTILLYAAATTIMGFSGYISGAGGRRRWLPVIIIATVAGSTIGMIGDLDRGTVGFITVNQQAMQDLAARLKP